MAFYISVFLNVLHWDRFVCVSVFSECLCCVDLGKALAFGFFCSSVHSELLGLSIVCKA